MSTGSKKTSAYPVVDGAVPDNGRDSSAISDLAAELFSYQGSRSSDSGIGRGFSREAFDFGMDQAAKDSVRYQAEQARASAQRALTPADLAKLQAQQRKEQKKHGRRFLQSKQESKYGLDTASAGEDDLFSSSHRDKEDEPEREETTVMASRIEPVGFVPDSLMKSDRAIIRRKKVIVGLVLVALMGISACITTSTPLFISPIEVIQIYGLYIQQLWLQVFDPAQAPTATEAMAIHPTFYWTLTNLSHTFVYALSGSMLALSGALYQNVFRNPIASPSMLGVSSGIQLGVAVMLIIFGISAAGMFLERYIACYCAVVVILVLLFGLARLMSGTGKPIDVTNMLVVGVIINQLIGVIITYLTWYVFDDELYDVFASLTSMVVPSNDLLSWAFLLAGFAVAVVPIALLRFRMNALGFNSEEMRMFGIRASHLQLIALICGTIIMVTAQLQVGLVAMITLVVPHISRAVFGAEFRKQFAGALLIGAAVLVACHIIATAIPYQGEVPVGVVVNLVLLPAFVWLIATQQRRWD